MQRTFLTNLALVLVLNLLVKPFYIIGIDAEVQVRVGTEAYGGYAALLSLSVLFNILLDVGMTNWNTRHMAHHTHLMRDHVRHLLTVRALLVMFYAVIVLGAGWVLGYRGDAFSLLAILVLNQALVSLVLYLRSNIAGAQRYAQDAVLSVLDRALLIAICSWLLWGRSSPDSFPLTWFAWAQTVAYGITAVVTLALVVRRTGRFIPRWDRTFTRSVLRQSFPFALLVLLMSFYYRTDTLMLERLLPDGLLQAGIYAQGFRFFEALNMLGFLLAGLLLPMYSRMLKQGDDVGPLTGLALRLVLVGTLAVAVIGCTYARALMDLRYDTHTAASGPVFAVLLWSFVAVCITYIFGTLLTASGDLRTLNRMAAGAMVLNIVLNLVLIHRWQALGAAWAGLITQVGMAVVQMGIAAKRFGLWPRRNDVLRTAAYLALLLVAALGAVRLGLSFLEALPLLGAWAVAASFATGLVSLRVLRTVLALREDR